MINFYRRIIDGVPSAVIVVNRNLKTVFTNDTFQSLFDSGTKRTSIALAVGCVNGCKHCDRSPCSRSCSFASVFRDVFNTKKPQSRRVFLKVGGTEKREIAFSISVKPLGFGLCYGVIDDALELEIARELATARNIQQRLLPVGKYAAGKKYSYMYIPCRDIGGDLPDVYSIGNSAYGVIADVSGKGISAGMLTAFFKAGYDKKIASPAEALTRLAQKFAELNLDERNYITVASARIDPGMITYAMAGHNVPLLLKSGNGITQILDNSPPVSNWFQNPVYYEDRIPYKKGDILVLLTDGVTESKNRFGSMFGIEGAARVLSVSRTGEDFIKNLEDALRAFCGDLRDDVTAIAFDL